MGHVVPYTAGSRRYAIDAELARGGMGVVHRALDRASGRHVALKRLLAGSAPSEHLKHLFHREYHTLRQLAHPRIIEVYDYGVEEEGPYYTMELLDGRDLRELAPLTYIEACRHLRDVASSLALLHARRLLHRDLSARNVRLTSDGRAKLLDFGALSTFGVVARVVGTPPLVPPEAIHGQPLDQRADLYAFGGLAYHLLTGHHAYPAQALHALPVLWKMTTPPAPSERVPGIPRALDELVMGLLSLEPSSRPTSAAEVIDRLNVIAGLESEEALDVGAAYLVTPRLVARERELERLRRGLRRIVAGRAQTVVIEGEPGAGKTRLLEEMTAHAQLDGAVVLRVDAERQAGPYAVARALVGALLAALPELAVQLGAPHAGVLGQVLPEVRAAFPDASVDKRSVDRNEQRVRIQTELTRWFESVALAKPLVLAVDDAHAADEPSLAFCAALSRRDSARAIGVIATTRTGQANAAQRTWEALCHGATRLSLARLSAEETVLLARVLFGDPDNAGRLGRWLHDRTDGNPAQCIALSAQLLRDGVVRYKDGAWHLPSELSSEGMPRGMHDVLERRVARLGEGARSLAHAVSILRGAFSIEQCLALTDASTEEMFRALDELVNEGIVVGVEGEYVFEQRALRTHLAERLGDALRRELHRRAGEFLLGLDQRTPTLEIEAGWHLLRAGDELRGAEILASVGSQLVTEIEGLALAAPGLEAALEVFERKGASKWTLLSVLEALTSAGWYVDRKYAALYGERALTLALEVTGLALAAKLAPFTGKGLAVKIGTTIAAIRHGIAKREIRVERLKSFTGAFGPLIGNIAIMVGVAANSFDAHSARRFLNAARMMSGFPHDHIVAVMYDYARYYVYASEGRLAEAEPVGERVLAWFERNENIHILGPAGEEGARAISGGQMLGIALFTALGGRTDALSWADRLERLGLSFYKMMASQARFVFHVARGELAQAAPYREQLELNAIAGGTTWQTSVVIPIALAMTHAAAGDAVRLRQAAEDLESTAREIPTLAPIAALLRASYQVCRDRADAALPTLARIAHQELRAREHMLGPFAAGTYARALLASGQVDASIAEARGAVGACGPYERQGIFTLEPLLALALAESARGDASAAAAQLDALILAFEPHGVPLALALLHEARASVARNVGDAASLAAHMKRFEHWAQRTECAALQAKHKRLTASDARGERPAPGGDARSADVTAVSVSSVRSLLERRQGIERAHAALRWIVENSGASRGYLFLGQAAELRLAAQLPDDARPSEDLLERVLHATRSLGSRLEDADCTATLTATTAGTNPSMNELTVQPLVVLSAGTPIAIGAVALALDLDAVMPVRPEVLRAIASSLHEITVTA